VAAFKNEIEFSCFRPVFSAELFLLTILVDLKARFGITKLHSFTPIKTGFIGFL
jgi:hypothetical protein